MANTPPYCKAAQQRFLIPANEPARGKKTKRKGSWERGGLQRAVWILTGKDERKKKKTLGGGGWHQPKQTPREQDIPSWLRKAGLFPWALRNMPPTPRHAFILQNSSLALNPNKPFLFQRVEVVSDKELQNKNITQSQEHKPVLMLLEKVTSIHKK